jgi:threonine/homoserine/homoserine lactone efflux protein
LIIGFSIAAPVGPIGVLCIRRTLAHGRTVGLLTGLGAATADGLYGAIAAFGLTALTEILIGHEQLLRLLGGVFLAYLGLKTFFAPASRSPYTSDSEGLLSAYGSTLVLTITNPLTIISFSAIFAGLGLGSERRDLLSACATVLGVFSGSALWWLGLSSAVSLLRDRVTSAGLRWVNRLSGSVIIAFAVWALLNSGVLRII